MDILYGSSRLAKSPEISISLGTTLKRPATVVVTLVYKKSLQCGHNEVVRGLSSMKKSVWVSWNSYLYNRRSLYPKDHIDLLGLVELLVADILYRLYCQLAALKIHEYMKNYGDISVVIWRVIWSPFFHPFY